MPTPLNRSSNSRGGIERLAMVMRTGVAICVLAAAASTNAQPADAGRAGKHAGEIQQRFKAADTNNDGKLTKDEAKTGMPMVYKHFDEIDTAKTGSVSLADIAAFAKSQRAKKGE